MSAGKLQRPERLAELLYSTLEVPNWAPWQRWGSAKELQRPHEIFPEGQFVAWDLEGAPAAALWTNRINWHGDISSLESWDTVAGNDWTFEDTYEPDGNTIVLMAISVRTDQRGQKLPARLIALLRDYAKRSGRIQHIISDFRPSDFSDYKQTTAEYDFNNYVYHRRRDGLPWDRWLRSITRLGMEQLRVDYRAMVIPATTGQVDAYRAIHKPSQWYRVADTDAVRTLISQHQPEQDIQRVDEVWECGETGSWYLNTQTGRAVYVESNLWGRLPLE
ncbi:hypothetical protein [Mycobacterium szulgai]|uniref:Uncharacterized protein n=1 Tax=Mycobacterium szulgai TaxID=1787 RepID=A0A1X2FJM0_MYCSZ|nr:hypothetical protein [Mycobacterium szulgai]MCV7078157.1 hypothetical protein [Mycobacterium szulgai]ORX18622.1 hypothetical protein AWC27_17390 [Mycobacterium szulgai]